jgi:phenylpropionate dioxygenase-like ring-hydroxylating dioxygenase large terminal subunit
MARIHRMPDRDETEDLSAWSLPAWIYDDPDFFGLERERIFMPSWQLVCHEADVPNAGDYVTFDFMGEPLVALRGADGAVRVFFNVCRHRASRLLDGPQGNCGRAVQCPYHAWTYGLDGALRKVPYEKTFENFDKAEHGLAQPQTEIWNGFVFARIEDDGGPSVAAMMAPYEEELAPYRFAEMKPLGRVTLRPRSVNWKNITDNYADGLHIPVAHDGLASLFGSSYRIEVGGMVHKMSGEPVERPAQGWSVQGYLKHLPEAGHLPEGRRRLWSYYKLFPNLAFDVYPDQIDFMQMIPVSPTETVIREIPYALPDERREMRAARYLNWRINRVVNAEDTGLVANVQAGMASRSYTTGPLSRDEVCLRDFAETMRRRLPVCRLPEAPPPEEMAAHRL